MPVIFDQELLLDYATELEFGIVCSHGLEILHSPDHTDFTWSYRPDQPISEICGSASGWAEWSREERRFDDIDRYRGLDLHWPANQYDDPIILVRGTDNRLHLIDGCHRLGISCEQNLTTIAAVIGELEL